MFESASARSGVPQEWRSLDARFGVVLQPQHAEQLRLFCLEVSNQETGGILVGRYNNRHDTATVTRVSGPPPDSRASRSMFQRGTAGLQRLLNRVWRGGEEYYLGEWHFHPEGEPMPSERDILQMDEIAHSQSYNCPEPILLIVGGKPEGEWSIRVFVYPEGKQAELVRRQ